MVSTSGSSGIGAHRGSPGAATAAPAPDEDRAGPRQGERQHDEQRDADRAEGLGRELEPAVGRLDLADRAERLVAAYRDRA